MRRAPGTPKGQPTPRRPPRHQPGAQEVGGYLLRLIAACQRADPAAAVAAIAAAPPALNAGALSTLLRITGELGMLGEIAEFIRT